MADPDRLCDRIIPQTGERVPIENFVDQKMAENQGDGYQQAGEPDMQQMWRRGLHALDQEARLRFGEAFIDLPGGRKDDVLHMIQRGDVRAPDWAGISPESFFKGRVLHDIDHLLLRPSERLGRNRVRRARHRPAATCAWVSTDTIRGMRYRRKRTVRMPDIVPRTPRGKDNRAPDVLRPGAWVPMRHYPDNEEVDFAIIGTGAGGGTLAAKLAEHGFSVVAFDAGPWFRPLDEFASDELEQEKLIWTDNRIIDGDNPVELGHNNSGKASWRQHRPLHDGLAPVSPRMVQIPQQARICGGLAGRLGGRCGATTMRSKTR